MEPGLVEPGLESGREFPWAVSSVPGAGEGFLSLCAGAYGATNSNKSSVGIKRAVTIKLLLRLEFINVSWVLHSNHPLS